MPASSPQSGSSVLRYRDRIAARARDAGLRNAQRPVPAVVVRDEECDLLGRSESGEEPELIVVALRFAPIPMERRNEPLGFLDQSRGAVVFTAT